MLSLLTFSCVSRNLPHDRFPQAPSGNSSTSETDSVTCIRDFLHVYRTLNAPSSTRYLATTYPMSPTPEE